MASRCKVYRKNNDGGFDQMIVNREDIPSGWSPDPDAVDKPTPVVKPVKAVKSRKGKKNGNN